MVTDASGWHVVTRGLLNGKTVRKLMKELGISSLIRVKNTVHIKENKDEFAIIS